MDEEKRDDLIIASEEHYTTRIRDAQRHSHRMAVTWSAVLLIFIILGAALYQMFSRGEAQWATAAISACLTAAVAFLFSRRQ